MRHDVIHPLYVEVDRIYNLACPASPIHYQFDPSRRPRPRVHGRDQHAGAGQAAEGRILQASTSEVYGDPRCTRSARVLGERQPDRPRACYDEGKRCAETLFFDYYRQNGWTIRVIRIFNTYGPRMHPNDGRVVVQLHRPGAQGQSRSPSTATAARRAPSATSTTWSTG
jgi:UDP-glucuronate decarboxylase